MAAVHALDGLLASGIDRGGIDDIGIVEGGGEIIQMIAQAGEAVRLDHGDHAVLHAFARGGQHGADFDRVMAVIVDDGGAINLAHLGEAALDPANLAKPVRISSSATPISTATATRPARSGHCGGPASAVRYPRSGGTSHRAGAARR
jgi:hypothetical protein